MTLENFARITESHALMRGCYANARERLRWARESIARGRPDFAIDDILSAEYWRECARAWRYIRDTAIEIGRMV